MQLTNFQIAVGIIILLVIFWAVAIPAMIYSKPFGQ